LLPAPRCGNKQEVRDQLRGAGREDLWTEVQGHVYGELIRHAPAYSGVREFFRTAQRRKVEVCIVSHKTRRPYLGAEYDLRQAALHWLTQQGLVKTPHEEETAGAAKHVFFEDTKEDKLRRIAAAGCTHFIDDLPEFLAEPGFPQGVRRILFDPLRRTSPDATFDFAGDWEDITAYLFSEAPA
jgi:hypothetical protein